MKRLLLNAVSCLLGWVLFAAAAGAQNGSAESSARLSFGFVPQQAPSRLLASWGPLLRELEARTGHAFVFRTAPDIPTFEQRLAAGEYDFAYMNPYHFTVFNQGETGYQALVHAEDKRIRGILVVRKESPATTLGDLDGQRLAFPAPAAFAASVLPRTHLQAEGIDVAVHYVSSHDSVYKAVARGLYAAGGGVVRTFEATDAAVRGQLRVLWSTPGYTPHAIAVHPRVEPSVSAAVREALLALDQSEGGRAALAGLKVRGYQAAANDDWDDVRALEIDARLGTGQ